MVDGAGADLGALVSLIGGGTAATVAETLTTPAGAKALVYRDMSSGKASCYWTSPSAVYYASADCTGTAYAPKNQATVFCLGTTDTAPGGHFRTVPGAQSALLDAGSSAQASGLPEAVVCTPGTTSLQAWPLEAVTVASATGSLQVTIP